MAQVHVMNAVSAERNKDPILQVLKTVLPADKDISVLEIASAYQQIHADLTNVRRPVYVDCTAPVQDWADGALRPATFDALLCCNMIHISPWVTTEGLFAGAAEYLKTGGQLITYGPYKFHGTITPESNVRFDESLKSRNATWGLRDVDDLNVLAEKNGLTYNRMFDMPANNKMLIFTKA